MYESNKCELINNLISLMFALGNERYRQTVQPALVLHAKCKQTWQQASKDPQSMQMAQESRPHTSVCMKALDGPHHPSWSATTSIIM